MTPNDLNLLRERLGPVGGFSINRENPLGDYLSTLSNLAGNLTEINATIPVSLASIEAGNLRQAETQVRRLNALRETSASLIVSLNSSLGRIADQYQIDTNQQLQKIRGFDALLQTYSTEIDRLNARLSALQHFVPTVLTLNASVPQIFIEENLTVYGFLKEINGTVLAGRNITISWGDNHVIAKQTDFRGRFEANVSFSIGYSAGPSRIEADYAPTGADSGVFAASSSAIRVDVMYVPSRISAGISQAFVHPLDEMSVTGNLADAQNTPLQAKTIMIELDGVNAGNTTTNNLGQFAFGFTVPETISNGTHTLNVVFPAIGERFTSSNETLPFTVEILGTVVQMKLSRPWILSGMNVSVTGNLTYASGIIPSGKNVTIYFDSRPYVNVTVNNAGSFQASIQAPFWLPLGSHVIKTEYVSQEPGVQGTQTVATVFVYSIPLIVFVATVIPTATALSAYLISRRKRAKTLAPIAIPEPVKAGRLMREEFSPETLTAAINAEREPEAKVGKAFRLAQTLIAEQLGEPPRDSETHWEYFSRVTKAAPSLSDSLRRLVELFELAEYSPYPVEATQTKEAVATLLELREELETVK
jgi:hypothetical protein